MEQDSPFGWAPATALSIVTTTQDLYSVVDIGGDIDLGSVPTLRSQLHQLLVDGRVHLVLDLHDVTFLDSTGLGVLVGIQKQVRIFRGSLVIVAPSQPVLRILELTALDKVFRIHATHEDALALDGGPHGARTD